MSGAQIVNGRVLDEKTAWYVGHLFNKAKKARQAAEAADAAAKRILAQNGISTLLVVTERGARLAQSANLAEREALDLIDECPRQVQADETWTG